VPASRHDSSRPRRDRVGYRRRCVMPVGRPAGPQCRNASARNETRAEVDSEVHFSHDERNEPRSRSTSALVSFLADAFIVVKSLSLSRPSRPTHDAVTGRAPSESSSRPGTPSHWQPSKCGHVLRFRLTFSPELNEPVRPAAARPVSQRPPPRAGAALFMDVEAVAYTRRCGVYQYVRRCAEKLESSENDKRDGKR
jgi:hypothetical protein